MRREEIEFSIIGTRPHKLAILFIILIVVLVSAGVYAHYQIQQQELIQFLNHYGAYNPKFKYEPFAIVDVDKLPHPAGNITSRNIVIAYTFNAPDAFDDVPYLRITYVSGPPCNISQLPSSDNCHQMLVIIPNNNVAATNNVLYAGPLNNYGFDLYTETGTHIVWRLYLFLATYVGTDQSGGASMSPFFHISVTDRSLKNIVT